MASPAIRPASPVNIEIDWDNAPQLEGYPDTTELIRRVESTAKTAVDCGVYAAEEAAKEGCHQISDKYCPATVSFVAKMGSNEVIKSTLNLARAKLSQIIGDKADQVIENQQSVDIPEQEDQ